MLLSLEGLQGKGGLGLPSPTFPVRILLITGILAFTLIFRPIVLPLVLSREERLTVLTLACPSVVLTPVSQTVWLMSWERGHLLESSGKMEEEAAFPPGPWASRYSLLSVVY